jgi:hypothetical protein
MGFGAIQGIPPLPPVVGPRSNADVTRVFGTEFGRRQGGEAESREESRRGLESDEDEEELQSTVDPASPGSIHIVI